LDYLDLCNTTHFLESDATILFDGLDVYLPEAEDIYTTSLDDPSDETNCGKVLHLFDDRGSKLIPDYSNGILVVPEQGNYTYFF
jgi:hypothetical protein